MLKNCIIYVFGKYQYLTPRKSSKILSFYCIFLYSLFYGLRTLYLLNWIFFRLLRFIALLLSFLDYYNYSLKTKWLLEIAL